MPPGRAASVQGSEAPRTRGPAGVCQQPPVVASAQFGGRRQSRRPGPTRLPQPWQRHRRLAAVGTIALRQCDRRAGGAVRGRRTAELGDCDSAPGLLGGRFRASTITFCVGVHRAEVRRDLGHAVVAWPGVAVISSLPAHALLPIVRSGSETDVDGGGCSATRAVARCACRSRRIGSPASTSTTPATAAKHGRGPVARMPGVVGDAVGCASGEFVTSGRPRARPALVPARVLVGSLPGWLQLFDGSQPAATPVFVSVRCIA